MSYRSRSKYTPGGGVLAFFEQVSRFVSLSVAGWVILSCLFILFAADGKVTDSFDLRLVRGVFTDWQLLWTVLVIVAINALIGALIAIPSAIVLLMTRQYLDFQAGRSSRRANLLKLKLVRALPPFILVCTHVLVLFVNLVAAPQMTRAWFRADSPFSSMVVGSHFVLSSLTRTSFDNSGSRKQSGKAPQAEVRESPAGKSLTLVLVPAEFVESEDFKNELAKIKGAQRIPYVMSRSNVVEQLEALFENGTGTASALVNKAMSSARDYNKTYRSGETRVVFSMSPQVGFGREPVGLATDSLSELKSRLFVYESQRRLLNSQVQIFGVLRMLRGFPFLIKKLDWLDLVADDVARIRKIGGVLSKEPQDARSVAVIQLVGFENRFANIQTPFRPKGWPTNLSAHEKKLITRNILRELNQYLQDSSTRPNNLWVMLPYADDKRNDPLSYAVVQSEGFLAKELHPEVSNNLGFLDAEMGLALLKFLGEQPVSPSSEALQTNASKQLVLKCFETDVSPSSSEFQFEGYEIRERSLGEFLNALPQLSTADLAPLNRNSLRLLSREPGFGFICKTQNQVINEVYLLKNVPAERGAQRQMSSLPESSILLSTSLESSTRPASPSRAVGAQSKVHQSTERVEVVLRSETLGEFKLYQFMPSVMGTTDSRGAWRPLDEREAKLFYSRFEAEALKAIEMFARMRIR